MSGPGKKIHPVSEIPSHKPPTNLPVNNSALEMSYICQVGPVMRIHVTTPLFYLSEDIILSDHSKSQADKRVSGLSWRQLLSVHLVEMFYWNKHENRAFAGYRVGVEEELFVQMVYSIVYT